MKPEPVNRNVRAILRHERRRAVDEFCLWHRAEYRRAPRWESLPPTALEDYVAFLDSLQLSERAIRSRLRALQSFFDFLVRLGFMAVSPLRFSLTAGCGMGSTRGFPFLAGARRGCRAGRPWRADRQLPAAWTPPPKEFPEGCEWSGV